MCRGERNTNSVPLCFCFQAEDGIRDWSVTGVQTCALPICAADAVEVLQQMIASAALDGVHLFFPDPWPKKRHHKRRLVQAPFVALLASRMKSGATVHTCTDWEDYARQMLEVLSAEPALRNAAPGYADRPEGRPETKFERRGLALGHRVWDLVFRKI